MGGKKSTSTSRVSIPPEVLARYNAVNARAQTAADTPYKAFGNTAADYVAQMNAQQNAGIADINATAGSYQPYMTQATAATQSGMGPAYEGIDNYMSPYIKNVADTTGAYMRQQQEQAQSGALGTAAMSGAFGGDRAGIAAANLQQQNQMGYGKTMADIMNQGYTQALGASQADLARQLQGGAQMAALGAQSQQLGLQGAQAKIAAGTMQQQTEQAGKDAMINQYMQEMGYPFQTAQFLANIAMGTGAAQGSTTTTETPRNWLGFASGGGVSGYADGGGVAGPRTYTQSRVGGEGYVPAGDLPVGQLMVADVPEQQQGSGTEDIIKLIASTMGANRGGAIDQRHGYAGGGTPSKWDMMLNDRPGVDSEFKALGRRALTTVLGATPFGANLGRVLPNLSNVATSQPSSTGVSADAITPAVTQATGVVAPTGVMPEGLAPITSMRPPARPAGLAGADVATDATATLGSPTQTSSLIDQTAPTLEPKPSNWDMADTGLAPTGGYGAIVPVKKQLDFVTYELQKPEYKGYLENTYATPAQAAVAFEQVYERANGAGNDVAAANATDIYNAARNGKLDQMPPNVVTAYNHFIQNGMDPIQAAGATGRLMVESYAHLDPNARNTLGGGNGTYGLAQWRGSRMEELANFAGVPLDAIANAPVSTPEGRYYSHGSDFSGGLAGGAGNAQGDGLAGADMSQQRDGLFTNEKPYDQRNMIGKFFHNRDGSLNSNAIMSLLGGLAKGAEAQTISPLGGILSGLGGGMETYKQLLKQTPEVTKANIENTNALQTAYLRAQQLNGYTGTIEEFAKSQGLANSPFGGNTGPAPTQGEMFGAPFDFAGQGMRTKIMLDGREVYAGQSLAWLQAYKNWLNSQFLTGLVDPNLVSSIDTAIDAAKTGNGQISDTSGNMFTDPAVRAGTFGAGQLVSSAERTQQILADISTGASRTQMEDAKLSELSNAVVGMGETGRIVEALLPYRQIAYELGLVDPNDTTVPNQEILRKGLAGDALNQLQAMGGDVATQSYLQQQANATFSGALTKPAIAEILAVRSGINEYNKAFYAYAKELKRTDPNADLYQAELNFKANKPLAQFIEEQRPIYKEAILNPPVPPVPPEADPELWASDPQYREDFVAGASP